MVGRGHPLTFFLPFIDTPANLFKEALRISPVGLALAVIDGAHAPKPVSVGHSQGPPVILPA
jgi:hypothetical protein